MQSDLGSTLSGKEIFLPERMTLEKNNFFFGRDGGFAIDLRFLFEFFSRLTLETLPNDKILHVT